MSVITDISPTGGVQVELLHNQNLVGTTTLSITTTQLKTMASEYTFVMFMIANRYVANKTWYRQCAPIVASSDITTLEGASAVLYMSLIQLGSSGNTSIVRVYSTDHSNTSLKDCIQVTIGSDIDPVELRIYGIKI